MNFLKRLFGGGQSHDSGMYFYIRSKRSGEVIQVRLDMNQLTPEYENERVSGYFTHKTLVGQRSFERLEAEFFFDPNKRLVEKRVSGGEFVTREDWVAQQADTEQA
ncbi:MAG: hypothetical protein Kow0077_31240 [Anaerolineae bacterium]